jgi:hypothetical protein
MTTGDWLITSLGAATALAGLALLLWSLLADRLRTRHARRGGTLRRCPRCWYDMSATGGLTCPECGQPATDERRLLRSRRHWRWAIASVLLLTLGAGTIAYPQSRGGAWKRWVPDTALILLLPSTYQDHWAANELMRRIGWGNQSPALQHPHRLAEWQWSLLRRRAAAAWLDLPDQTSSGSVWNLMMLGQTVPDPVFNRLHEMVASDDRNIREWAFMCLEWQRFHLNEQQLESARAAIEQSPAQQGFEEKLRQNPIRMLGVQLASRQSDSLVERRACWAHTPMTPDALLRVLDHSSINELAALFDRFHFQRSSLFDTDESIPDAIVCQRIDLPIDDDDLPDCVLLLYNHTWQPRETNVHYEALVLLQKPRGWSFLGRMNLSNCLEGPPEFFHLEGDDGTRWLVVRRDSGSSNDGKYFVIRDVWYRVDAGRLAPEQTMLHRGHAEGLIDRELTSSEPIVVRRGSGYAASYDITSTLSLTVPDSAHPDAEPRLIPIDEQRGTFEFPLGVPDTQYARFTTPGPWAGKDPTWAFLNDPKNIIPAYHDQLLAIAARGDDERAAALAAIDEYISWAGPTPELTQLREELGTDPSPP